MITEKKDDAVTKQDAAKTILKDNPSNYKTIFMANGLLSFADGIYYPFFIVFLHTVGDIFLIGGGLGLLIIFGSLGNYFAGKWADKYGKKPFLLLISVISVAIFMAYPLLPLLETADHSLMFLVLITILFIDGIASGVWQTVEAAYLGDITSKASRGSKIGSYWGVSGFVSGAAMIGAGFLGVHIDFLTAAVVASSIYLSGFFLLLRVKEM